jgi:outer membrane immunogenic protein
MKTLALAFTALAALGGQAVAADMAARPVKAPPPVVAPVANWSGCYISGGIGYGLSQSENISYFNAPPRVVGTPEWDQGSRGWLGRVGGGCDYQFSSGLPWQIVVGVFGDYDFADINGRRLDSFAFVHGEEKLDQQWAVGGRIGLLVTPQLLTYFSGGYTEAQYNYGALSFAAPPFGTPAGFNLANSTYKGWFLGSGLEYQLGWAPGLFVKTEYRFSEFDVGTDRYRFNGTNVLTGFEVDTKKFVQTVTTSLVWKFNFGGAPLVARY